jgi:hypothetical protein
MTERERLWVPPPQEWVQSVHAPNDDTSHPMGHGPWLHAVDPVAAVQAFPPCAAGVSTLRERCFVPSSQETEHSDHAVQAPMTQSTGQDWLLHCSVWACSSHATPP